MNNENLKILLIIEQCNPEWASVPLVGYYFYNGIRKLADVTLITHERNRNALEKVKDGNRIEYINESFFIKTYYNVIKIFTSFIRGTNWPLLHTLNYPIYARFNREVNKKYGEEVSQGVYDIVHAITPMIPRYSVKIIDACTKTPFILGPVNGGVPFPSGFEDVAKKEYAHFNFLRFFSRFIPGYSRTYKKADKILSGSTYTLNMLKNMFYPDNLNIELFFENGINKEFIHAHRTISKEKINLLFVGRLVPYKGADMAIEAINQLDERSKKKIQFTVVGDGPERQGLEKLVNDFDLKDVVHFTGWVDQDKTPEYYKNSDIFCFPSVREFGGAVVLEAMASGLPCIVADQGGIGEYVTHETGFKIKPVSRDYLTNELTKKIKLLIDDESLRLKMAKKAVERGGEFEWGKKAKKIFEIYERLINKKL